MIEEIAAGLTLPEEMVCTVVCRAFKDNQGTLLLANNQRLSNRTRHYNCKWHWFWQHVLSDSLRVLAPTREQGDRCLRVLSINTTEQ